MRTLVVVIILGGAAPALIDRWSGVGALPSLQALSLSGMRGVLASLPVPYELPALATALSGAPPGEHGCFSCWNIHPERFGDIPEVVSSDDVGARFIWEQAAPSGVRAAVVNVFGTHPPRVTDGYLISYPFYPTVHGCTPSGLLRELLRSGVPYAHDVAVLYRGGPRDEFFSQVARVESARMAVCQQLMERDVNLCVFNITLIDRLSHFWWREVEPEAAMDDHDTVLWRAYRLVDAFVGSIMNRLRAEDHLLVFSDVGFGPLRAFVSLDDALAAAGFIHLVGGQVDADRSLAMEAVQGSHGVNLNLRRRYPNGAVTEEGEASLRREVSEALVAAVNPHTGGPLVKRVIEGRSLYPGSRAHLAPDLIVQPHDERYVPQGDRRWAARVYRGLQTGWHRRSAFWAAMGPRFLSDMPGRDAECGDVAQTIADLLGIDLPLGEGRSLANRA